MTNLRDLVEDGDPVLFVTSPGADPSMELVDFAKSASHPRNEIESATDGGRKRSYVCQTPGKIHLSQHTSSPVSSFQINC